MIPQYYEKDKSLSLGQWISRQRAINKEDRMRLDRFQLLEDIEFVWKVDVAHPEASHTQRQWDEMYQHLVEFQETHGHPNVPQTYQEWGLGAWVAQQRMKARAACLDPRREDKLKAIGFTWGKDKDERWEENFEALLAFKRKHGHCKGPFSDGKLGNWVRVQRVAKKNENLKPEKDTRLEEVGFTWNGQSHSEAVVGDSDNDNDLDSAKASNKNGEIDNTEPHNSDQARASKSSIRQLAKKPPVVDHHATEETADDRESLEVGVDSSDHVKVGTRLSVLWGDGYYYGGIVTKMKNQDNKRICYVEYYDGENAWHNLEMEKYFIVYSVGTKVYKQFPDHGYYWGEITVSKDDMTGLCYQVEYSAGDLETITDESDSAPLLEELYLAVLAAKQKENKRKQQDSKITVTNDSRKRRKIV
jgi:hypothetical protein